MAFPPAAQKVDFDGTHTRTVDQHAENHNLVGAAINDIVAELGASPKAEAATLTALVALLGPLADVQTFTSSGTWTKPAGTRFKTVRVLVRSGTAGAGSGARRAAGVIAGGGGGAGGAGWTTIEIPFADVGATETVTIGAAGTGGAAVLVDDTNGNAGTLAGLTSFGPWVKASTSGAGGGGTNAAGGTAGTGSTSLTNGNSGGAGSVGAAAGATGGGSGSLYAPGGGGGGGISAANVEQAGGPGGSCPWASADSAGTARLGGLGGAIGAPGTQSTFVPGASSIIPTGGSGGGGASATAAAGAGANSLAGAGAGGGGGSRNGFASGKGGDGAPGLVIVICR